MDNVCYNSMRYKNMFIYLLLKFSFKNYKYILIILFTLSLIVGINQLSSLSQYNQGYAQISPSFVRQEILDAHGDWQLVEMIKNIYNNAS